jgi:hypothetical protein
MNFIYKLFGGGGESDDIYNSIPWKEINTISSSDPKMDEIYKKLVLLSTKYKSDLTPQQSPLVMLYKKSLAKKLSPEIVDKLTSEVLESAEPLLEVSKPLVETSKPIEEVSQPKLLNPILSPVCNQDTECKLEFNEIPWKLLQTLTGDDPRTRESLEHLEHLDLHYRDKFDTNTQQLILLYIKTLKKRLGEYRHSTPSPLLTKSDNKLHTTDNKLHKTDNKLHTTDNKYCRPFYLEGNRYFCVGTSLSSDNDTKRCVFNKDKRVDLTNVDNIDLDPHCENNQEYKSPYQEASI